MMSGNKPIRNNHKFDSLVKIVMIHEGFREKPYKCSADRWTIGYGSTFNPFVPGEMVTADTTPISQKTAELWLREELEISLDHILYDTGLTRHHLYQFGENRINALANMNYNLGARGLAGFKKMWHHLFRYEYKEASREAMDSQWAKQVGRRAGEISYCLHYGEWPDSMTRYMDS